MVSYRLINAGLVIFVAITTLLVLLTGMLSTTNTLMRNTMLKVNSGLISKQYNITDVISGHPQDNNNRTWSSFYHPSLLDQLWVQVNEHLLIRRLAYFDTRETSHHSVVFISLHRGKNQSVLFSLLSYKNSRTKCVKLEYWAISGDNNNPRLFTLTWMLRTMSSEKEIPVQAQIATDKYCHNLTVSIPILSNIPDKNLTYGVCLHQGLFALKDAQSLVDWIELNLALGAEIITVYLQDVPESFYNLIQPYIKKGVVEVLDWSLKPPLNPTGIDYYGQNGVINECIYRNLYRVKYLALIDIDEFIVPQQTSSVIEMLQTLEKRHQNVSSYTFYNTFMYKGKVNLPEVKFANKCSNMTWPRYYTYTLRIDNPVAQHRIYPCHKLIVKPQAVISCWVHFVLNASAGYDTNYNVPADVGLTFHYRAPGKKDSFLFKNAYYHKKTKQCFSMSRFFQQTYNGIKRRMCP